MARALLVHGIEEILVGLRILHLVEEELHRINSAHLHENPAEHPHLRKIALFDEKFFLAGPGFPDIQ
jgi:hypothetical protein